MYQKQYMSKSFCQMAYAWHQYLIKSIYIQFLKSDRPAIPLILSNSTHGFLWGCITNIKIWAIHQIKVLTSAVQQVISFFLFLYHTLFAMVPLSLLRTRSKI